MARGDLTWGIGASALEARAGLVVVAEGAASLGEGGNPLVPIVETARRVTLEAPLRRDKGVERRPVAAQDMNHDAAHSPGLAPNDPGEPRARVAFDAGLVIRGGPRGAPELVVLPLLVARAAKGRLLLERPATDERRKGEAHHQGSASDGNDRLHWGA